MSTVENRDYGRGKDKAQKSSTNRETVSERVRVYREYTSYELIKLIDDLKTSIFESCGKNCLTMKWSRDLDEISRIVEVDLEVLSSNAYQEYWLRFALMNKKEAEFMDMVDELRKSIFDAGTKDYLAERWSQDLDEINYVLECVEWMAV